MIGLWYTGAYVVLYLEEGLVVPVGVDVLKLMSYAVVLSCPQRVHTCQHQLFVYSYLSYNNI